MTILNVCTVRIQNGKIHLSFTTKDDRIPRPKTLKIEEVLPHYSKESAIELIRTNHEGFVQIVQDFLNTPTT